MRFDGDPGVGDVGDRAGRRRYLHPSTQGGVDDLKAAIARLETARRPYPAGSAAAICLAGRIGVFEELVGDDIAALRDAAGAYRAAARSHDPWLKAAMAERMRLVLQLSRDYEHAHQFNAAVISWARRQGLTALEGITVYGSGQTFLRQRRFAAASPYCRFARDMFRREHATSADRADLLIAQIDLASGLLPSFFRLLTEALAHALPPQFLWRNCAKR